jgi:hypothetical protein
MANNKCNKYRYFLHSVNSPVSAKGRVLTLSRRKQGFESPRERHPMFFRFLFSWFAKLERRVCHFRV